MLKARASGLDLADMLLGPAEIETLKLCFYGILQELHPQVC